MTKSEATKNLYMAIRNYHQLKGSGASVSVAVSAALGAGKDKAWVFTALHKWKFKFDQLSYVLKRHLYTPSQSGRADAEEGVLLASSDPSYVEAYEGYIRTHPNCTEARNRDAEALRRVEERVHL